MYFRILEIEYNEKFVVPFANHINIEELKGLCGRGKEISDRTEEELRSYVMYANRAAALTCSRPGAIPAMPTAGELG